MQPSEHLTKAIKEYRDGKQTAFDVIYHESAKYLYVTIQGVVGRQNSARDVCEEMLQETFLEIFKHLDALESEENYFSWASKIARNKCLYYIKKNSKYVLLDEDDTTLEQLADRDDVIPETIMQDKEKRRLVREIIDTKLTEMQRLCIIAFYYNGLKQSEIAAELEIPENTVKTHLARGKAKIQDGIEKLEKDNDIRLHSVAPFLLLLFREDIAEAVLPPELAGRIASSLGLGSEASGGAAATEVMAEAVEAETAAAAETVVNSVESETVAAGIAERAVGTEIGTGAVASETLAGTGGGEAGNQMVKIGLKGLAKKAAAASIKTKVMVGIATLGVVGVVATAVLLPETKEPKQDIEYTETEHPGTDSAELEDRTPGTEPGQAGDDGENPNGQAATGQTEVKPELPRNDVWLEYYRKVLPNMKIELCEWAEFFDLYDFDRDGIPEIILLGKDEEKYIEVVKYVPEEEKVLYWYGFGEYNPYIKCSGEYQYDVGYIEDCLIVIEHKDSTKREEEEEQYFIVLQAGEDGMKEMMQIDGERTSDTTYHLDVFPNSGYLYEISNGEVEQIISLLKENMQPCVYTTHEEAAVEARIEEVWQNGSYQDRKGEVEFLVGGEDDGIIQKVAVTITGTETPEWRQAYREFLLNSVSTYLAFALHDFDENGTPELICYDYVRGKDIYTYRNGYVEEVNYYWANYDRRGITLLYGENPGVLYELTEQLVSELDGSESMEAALITYQYEYSEEKDSYYFEPDEKYKTKWKIGGITFSRVLPGYEHSRALAGEEVDRESIMEQYEAGEYWRISEENITKEFDAYEKEH